MKKRFLLCLLVASGMLSACGASDGSPREGQYQQTVKITELDFPGITGDTKTTTIQQMEQAAGGGTGGMFCMTGNDGGKQWKEVASQMAGALGGDCDTIKDEGSETRIDLEMKCTGTAKGDMEVTMLGRATTEGYDSKMAFAMKDPSSGETAKLAMNINAERVGDCPG